MAYSPKYVNVDDVPLHQVPDNYSMDSKQEALEFAESALELDVNGGAEIPSGKVNTMMRAAVKQKATCELVKAAQDPTETKLGDLSDDGTTKTDYAQSFCQRYVELVEKITEAGVLDPESGGNVDPYVYNTSPSKDRVRRDRNRRCNRRHQR